MPVIFLFALLSFACGLSAAELGPTHAVNLTIATSEEICAPDPSDVSSPSGATGDRAMHLLTSEGAGIVLILSGSMLMLWPTVLLAAGYDSRRSLVVHAGGSVLVMAGVLSQRALAPHLGPVVLVVAMELLILPVQIRLPRRTHLTPPTHLTRRTGATPGSGRP